MSITERFLLDPMVLGEQLDVITLAYLEGLLWCSSQHVQSTHEGCPGEDCDTQLDSLGYDISNVDDSAYVAAFSDVSSFITGCLDQRPSVFDHMDLDQIGHDFALTRNGHGAGFWDRGYGERGTWLTEQCRPYGDAYVFVDDASPDVRYYS